MSSADLHSLNQRYIRVTDRCRAQWTFYQLLQGAFKHLREVPCPIEIDFPSLFARFRAVAEELAHPETTRVEATIDELEDELERNTRKLLRADAEMPPSMLRRFFDGLRRQDEKVILAIIKFYLDTGQASEDVIDKLDILFTRLAELPREGGGTLIRERHEIDRMVQPLLQRRANVSATEGDVTGRLDQVAAIRAEALAATGFAELAAGGALDRFRSLKRDLGESYLDPRLLPSLLETTVAIKNRFRELWEDEEQQILSDTNRVMEARRLLDRHPEIVNGDLRDMFDTLAAAQQRIERGRKEEKVRREDVVELRRVLDKILEQTDSSLPGRAPAEPAPAPARPTPAPTDAARVPARPRVTELFEAEETEPQPVDADQRAPREPSGVTAEQGVQVAVEFADDPLLHEYISKIVFAMELVGPGKSPGEIAHAKEVAALRLEAWEVEAIQAVSSGELETDTIIGQRARAMAQSTALRIRLDEEAREIGRLRKRESDRLPELLDQATQSLQRAAELERRFQWFIDDALYRGATERLETLTRSRMRLLRAYSGLWLIHNDSGGVSPY